MHADIFVVRHSQSGAPYLIAQHLDRSPAATSAATSTSSTPATAATPIPTQGLLDAYTIRHYKQDFTKLRVAIVGDVLHSRRRAQRHPRADDARVPEVRVIGPRTLLPAGLEQMGVSVHTDMAKGTRRGST